MKNKLIVIIVLLTVAAGGAALVHKRKTRNATVAPLAITPVTVSARTLENTEVVLTRPAVAEVRALTEAVVASRLSAYVVDMPFLEGRRVKKGEVLARLDAAQAEAELARAGADLARSRQQEGTLTAEQGAAGAALEAENDRFNRLEGLYRIGGVSLEQVQSGKAALAAARARMSGAEAAFNAYKDSLHAAEAGVKAARENLRYAVLTAPFDGVVSARLAQPGDLAIPGKPLYKLVSGGDTRLLVSLPEEMAAAELRLGGKFLALSPWPEATPQGMLRFEASAGGLTPGSRQPVEVVMYRDKGVFLPDDCLLAGEAGQAQVLVPAGDKVKSRNVRLSAQGTEGAVSTDMNLVGAQVLCGSADALMRLSAGAPLKLFGSR